MVPELNRAPSSAQLSTPATVLVVGEALVDEFDDGSCVAGGAPFNVARWLAALGVPTCFVSRVGKDDEGARCLLDSARRVGLAMQGVQVDDQHPTGRVRVTRTEGGHRFAIGSPAAWDHIDADQAMQALQATSPAVVVFGSLAQRHPTSRRAITQLLQNTTALRVADLNLRAGTDTLALAEHTLQLADCLKVNEDEWAQLLAWFAPSDNKGADRQGGASHPPEQDAQDAQETQNAQNAQWAQLQRQALMRRFQLQRVVLTCGERGWLTFNVDGCVDASGAAEAVPNLVDTVGAGDSFLAVLVAAWARKQPLVDSLQAANRLAAAVCGQQGAMPNDDAFISHWRDRLTPS